MLPTVPRTFNPLSFVQIKNPVIRLLILCAVMVFMIGIVISLRSYAKSPAAKEISRDAPALEVKKEVPAGVPPLDTTFAERVEDSGPDARRRWPEDAVRYLLLEAGNTPAVYSYARNLLPLVQGSAAEIDKDSRPWRFKFVRFRGDLEYRREEDYKQVYGPDGPETRVCRGRVLAPGEPPLRIVFITPDIPRWADTNDPGIPEMKLIEDGWVRGRGILVGNYIDTDNVPALLVVATQVERDFAPVRVESLKDVPFEIIEDDPAIATTEGGRATLAKEYPRPLFRLLQYAQRLTGADAAQRRAEHKPEHLNTRKVWEELVGQPSKFRGRYCRGLGAIVDSPYLYLPETITPNDAGIEEYITGWILTDEHKIMQFVAPASLNAEWNTKTRIRWEGFFYKSKLYQARNGSQPIAPVFVLTLLEEVKIAKPSHTLPIVLGGIFVFGMVLFGWAVAREDRTKQAYRSFYRSRIAAARAGGAGPDGSAGGPVGGSAAGPAGDSEKAG